MTSQAKFVVELITEEDRLSLVAKGLMEEPRVAVDTESDGFHRYPQRICLVQVATDQQCYLIDATAISDMSPLGRLLADEHVQKVLHSADNDIRSLDRQWGFRLRNIYDTSIGARLVGMEHLGLGAVLQQFLDLKLEKRKELQRADWGLRPLSSEALAYAAEDVGHLLELRDVLAARIESLRRTDWMAEECQRLEGIRYSTPEPPETAFLLMKGSSILDGAGLAVLRELVVFRQNQAVQQGKPPFRILSDAVLLSIARDPAVDLSHVQGLSEGQLHRFGRGLREATYRGMRATPVRRRLDGQPWRPRPTFDQMDLSRKLRQWREREACPLHLDPSLIWPAASLERLAREPGTLDQELGAEEVRRWQVRQFGSSLREFLKKAR